MEDDQLRLSALQQAALDEKHQNYGNNNMSFGGVGPPNQAAVIARAKAYLAFLQEQTQAKPRKRRR